VQKSSLGEENTEKEEEGNGTAAFQTHSALASVVSVDFARLGLDLDDVLLLRSRDSHAVFDFSGHGDECLLDVCAALSGSLEEGDAQGVCKVLGCVLVHLALVLQVALVAHKELVHVLTRIALDLTQPLLHVRERLCVRNVVNDNDAVRSTIVGRGDGAETFLSCCIPNLELDRLAVQLDGADLKVHTDGADIALCVCVVCKTEEKTALADTTVANKKELEEVIVFGIHVEMKKTKSGE